MVVTCGAGMQVVCRHLLTLGKQLQENIVGCWRANGDEVVQSHIKSFLTLAMKLLNTFHSHSEKVCLHVYAVYITYHICSNSSHTSFSIHPQIVATHDEERSKIVAALK